MSPCSFLSTKDNEIECFADCAFYNWEENGGVCPFKGLTGNRFSKMKELLKLDFFEDEDEMGEEKLDIKEIDEYYIDNKFI